MQRNIVAERVLGLPHDVDVAKASAGPRRSVCPAARVVNVDLIEAAEGVQELVEAHADKAEQGRRLPKRLVQALRDAQLFRMCVPAVYGGPEADPITLVRAIETRRHRRRGRGVVHDDRLDDVVDEHVHGARVRASRSSATRSRSPAASFAPNGRAVADGDGWRVTGRWQWGSGTQHCHWIIGGANTDDGEFHLMFFDAADVSIHDTWYSSGLRGTGSNDFSVDGAFVPRRPHRCSRWSGSARSTARSPRSPTSACWPPASPRSSLGIARHAIDEFTELGQGKRPDVQRRRRQPVGLGAGRAGQGRGAAALGAGVPARRAGPGVGDCAVGRSGRRADAGRIRLACVHAAEAAARATDVVYTLGGGTSVFESSPLQRCLRDAHVATQHLLVSPRLYETLGKMFFGQDIDVSTF